MKCNGRVPKRCRPMKHNRTHRKAPLARRRGGAIAAALAFLIVGPASPWLTTVSRAQDDKPPVQTAEQLDKIVGPIALYSDPLLAQTLTAATFPDQIPGAYKWATDHAKLKGDEMDAAMEKAQLPYDPCVQALIPFPSVLK